MVDPGPAEPVTPEPGVGVLTQQLPDEVLRVARVYPDLAREAGVEGTVHRPLSRSTQRPQVHRALHPRFAREVGVDASHPQHLVGEVAG